MTGLDGGVAALSVSKAKESCGHSSSAAAAAVADAESAAAPPPWAASSLTVGKFTTACGPQQRRPFPWPTSKV